ncbi:energy-coupling factor transporter transmembrane component T [Hathewaya histolytica]|uniref:energy-coupling factor transporter transmembrane component T n=1 Tax=Hathewaya histolytica TaxID=1498 RepID=UPI003B680CF4
MLTYKNRNSYLQGLHPLSGVMLLLLYLITFIVMDNPLYIILIMNSILFLSYIDGSFKELFRYIKLIIPFALLIIIINPILVKNGETVIYEGTINYPIFGTLRITVEAILFGCLNGLRIICITLVFGFFNLVIHPDRAFAFFSKYLKNSALLMSMTIRLFPSMIKSFNSIKEVEKLRGNKLVYDNIKKTLISQGNIVNILFLSSMEDASDMAEAMYSRGYGASKKRSSYFKEKFKKDDLLIISLCLIGLINLFLLKVKGYTDLEFYPKVQNPIESLNVYGYIFCAILFSPFFINWRWKTWK